MSEPDIESAWVEHDDLCELLGLDRTLAVKNITLVWDRYWWRFDVEFPPPITQEQIDKAREEAKELMEKLGLP